MVSNNPVLKWRDYLIITFRSFFLQSGFNYGNYQGIGYAYVILPALQKIYANNKEMLISSTVENIEFYNTNPQVLPFITSLHLAILDSGQSPEDARSIKMALMGPFAGIGDSMFQFGLAPLFSSIGAGLAAEGMIIGPILFFLGINASLIGSKLLTGYYGYKVGTSVIDKLSESMASISRLASIVGVAVVSGLAVTFVKVNLALQYAAKMPNGKSNVISVQTILDKITPGMMPVLFTILVYILIRKFKWTTYKLILLTIAIGMAGSLLGILV